MAKRTRRHVDDPYVELSIYGREILESEEYRRLLNYKQHHNSTTFLHSVYVTLRALEYARDHFIKVDVEALVKMCLLHDYFLYDWHIKPHPKHHATAHPLRAADNAEKDFDLDDFTLNGIRSHMWPIAIRRIPTSREAWILAYADKCVTLNEVLGRKQRFQKERLYRLQIDRRQKAFLERLAQLSHFKKEF